MHIPDGMVPLTTCVAGFAATGLLNLGGLRNINRNKNMAYDISRISMVTGVFFIASLIHIPFPPTSVHPILSGICGIVMGIYAPIVITISLLLQAILFGYGGITTLGINSFVLCVPALLAWQLHTRLVIPFNIGFYRRMIRTSLIGLVCTSLSVLMYALVISLSLPSYLDQSAEIMSILILSAAHLPLIIVEAIISGFLGSTNILERLNLQSIKTSDSI